MKIYNNKEINEEEVNEIIEEFTTVRRAICNRKKKNKNHDDLSLRIPELKNFIVHYEKDIFVLKERILDFEGLKDN